MAQAKSEVVSVRVPPETKAGLQSAADIEMRSLANMVEVLVVAYCRSHGYPSTGVPDDRLPATKPKAALRD